MPRTHKLLLLLSGFAIGFLAQGYVRAQDVEQAPVEHKDYPVLTVPEIIEILADYDLRHVESLPGVPYYGMTDYDGHTILIVNNQDFIWKRKTVYHELLHVAARLRGEVWDEETVQIIEDEHYKKLFVNKQ